MPAGKTEYVDFEIAFSAFLATIVVYISVESFSNELFVESIAILLLFLTLVRRVGLVNGLETDHILFPTTTHLMSGISYISGFYVLYWVSEHLSAVLQYGSTFVFLVITFPAVMSVILFQELALGGGFMRETEQIFNKASLDGEGTLGGALWGRLSAVSHQSRMDVPEHTVQKRLTDYKESKPYNELTDQEQKAIKYHIFGSIVGLMMPFVVYGVLGLGLAYWLDMSPWVSLAIVLCFHFVTVPFDILLSGYGLIRLNDTGWMPKVIRAAAGIVFCTFSIVV